MKPSDYALTIKMLKWMIDDLPDDVLVEVDEGLLGTTSHYNPSERILRIEMDHESPYIPSEPA